MTSPHWKVMNDLSETITSFLTIRDILRDSNGNKQLVDAAVVVFEHYIDIHDKAFVKAWDEVVREPQTKNYRAVIDEYNQLQDSYNDLKMEHEALQCLFVQEEYDHDELKVKYDELRVNYDKVQKDYHTVVTNIMNKEYDC